MKPGYGNLGIRKAIVLTQYPKDTGRKRERNQQRLMKYASLKFF
jgi:hypothetical protein